jgi:2',3'-cyclic-nucleotide 2'-phosphodiesterase (5'-nucleotidase family)
MKKAFLILTILINLSQSAYAEDIYILYTSNTNGMIENCGCGADPLGGIARVKSFIDQFRQEHLHVFVIDGGDYFNSYPFPELNEAMFSAFILMHYDFIVPGDQAFVEGEDFFSKYVSNLGERLILTNARSGFETEMIKKYGSYQIQIYGYLSPYVFDFIPEPEFPSLTNFVEAKPEPAEFKEFQIAVIHGYRSNAEQFAVENPSVRLILLGHDQRKGIWEKNQATIIGNGKDSEYISVIKLAPENNWNISVEQQKIHEDLPEDKQIVRIIESYKNN